MKRLSLSCFCVCLSFLFVGCSVHSSLQHFNISGLESEDGSSLIDPNNGPYSIEILKRADGTVDYFWDINSRIEQAETCRVKYHNLWNTARFMVIEGSIGRRNYPVILDTGASQAVFVKNSHIKDNKLPIYPIKTIQFKGFDFGLCYLPRLMIADISLVDWPCFYLNRRGLFRLFANSADEDKAVILGLPALREFKYILFDSIKKEVEFSTDKDFETEAEHLWLKYPLSIEEDFQGNAFLFVQIPVNGKSIEVQFDTGNGNGLAVTEEIWDQIRQSIPKVSLKKVTQLYPYIGRLKCRKAVVPQFSFAGRIIKNANVSVFPDDSNLLEECGGLLGMQYFRDTVIVLDFERDLLWVRE